MTEPCHRVLVVEDDASVRLAITLVLEREGLEVVAVGDGREATRLAREDLYDLVLLDLMLPSLSGLEVCRDIRTHSRVPIIMVTARSNSADVVAGLDVGADDYVTKPFEPSELSARARSAIRRATEANPSVWQIHDLVIDEAGFRVTKAGAEVTVSVTEMRLLLVLARHPGQVMTREVLLERVWGYDFLGDSRLVDMAMLRLRNKLGPSPTGESYVTTVRSIGYRFERD